MTPSPTTPGPAAPAPSTGAPRLAPVASLTPLGLTITDTDSWSVWWRYNRERYLDGDRRARRPVTPTGEDEGALPAVPPQVVFERIVPALRTGLDESNSAAVRSAALLALARVGEYGHDELSRTDLERVLLDHLDDGRQSVAETACIGLGILGRPSSLSPLRELCRDTRDGRELYGRSEVSLRMRAFAAYGIGLLGQRADNADVRRYATHALTEALAAEPCAAPDDRVAAVIALGLIAPEGRGTGAAACSCVSNDVLAAELLELFEDTREDQLVRAQVPPTLARISAHASPETRASIAQALTGSLNRRAEREPVKQGCALALGLMGDGDEDALDQEIRRSLEKAAVESNRLTASFALVSLAQAGARSGDGAGDPRAGAVEARAFLVKRFSRAKGDERAWIALALGVLGRGVTEDGLAPDQVQLDALRMRLDDSRSPDEAAACSIAAGLCRDQGAHDLLLAQIEERQDGGRGHAALGLGMAGSAQAAEALHALLDDARHEPDVIEQTAMALHLLEDPELVSQLMGLLVDCDCLITRRAVAIGLGRSRDARATEPLLAMFTDREAPDEQRTHAAFGLALLAEPEGKHWSWRLSTDLHYRANPATLTSAGRDGILDLP